MQSRSSRQSVSKVKRSRKYKSRDSKLNLGLERLEDRAMMALGPTLVAINPNTGAILANNDLRNIAPTDLTFRFDDGQVIDAASLSGIRITRSGGDGVFGAGSPAADIPITAGFIGLGETPNEVVFRFAERLPDDVYLVNVGAPLKNAAGDPFDADRSAPGNQDEPPLQFRLDLGAKVVAVVPQPVTRDANGRLQQRRNTIEVFFNANDPLVAGTTPVTTVVGNPNSGPTVVQPRFYELTTTENTVDNSNDDSLNPQSVTYDPVSGKATLTFFTGFGIDTLRLRIGTSEGTPLPPTSTIVGIDPGSSFGTATVLEPLVIDDLNVRSQVFTAVIEPQFFPIDLPGSNDEPGHRDINNQNHLGFGVQTPPDPALGIETIFYNFRPDYGTDPDGNPLTNDITPAQKDRAREIFELLGNYMGVKFVESTVAGITVATGDVREIFPFNGGPNGLPGAARGGTSPLVILNGALTWNENFGGDWFQTAMGTIEQVLGADHSFELPPITLTGDDLAIRSGLPLEPVFPGDHDIVHLQHLHRPESKDIDLYRFTVTSSGLFSAETFAERQPDSSLLDTALRLYRENADGTRTLLSQNDDYYSKDSFIQLDLAAGTYYIGVSASGNTSYDPEIVDSGFGGTSQGKYDLRLDFRTKANNFIEDAPIALGGIATTPTAFDGDADGVPGGVYNFWFRSQTPDKTIFVDKAAPTGGTGRLGSITNPFLNIDDALDEAARPAFAAPLPGQGAIVRIVGNGFVDGDNNTADSAVPYEIGKDSFFQTLKDGATMAIPKDTMVMIDSGAVIKLSQAHIAVGSSSSVVDRSGSALQVLGTPERSVFFTSYNDEKLAADTNPGTVAAGGGDWGGIRFQSNLDQADNRFVFEDRGNFVNYVNHADMRFGGGQVEIEGVSQVVTPVQMIKARPTVSFNAITASADAAISANPDSFEETNFHAPQFQASVPFTSDYTRVGPEIHDNRLLDNTLNGLLIRVTTASNTLPERMTVAGRWDDADIVHVVSENLLVNGTPGGPILETSRPPVSLVTLTEQTGGTLPLNVPIRYVITFVDADGNEGLQSTSTSPITLTAGRSVLLNQLPKATLPFVARRIYRSVNGGSFTLAQQINPNSTSFVDDGTTVGGTLAAPDVTFVTLTGQAGGSLPLGSTVQYILTFVNAAGIESPQSAPTGTVTLAGAQRSVQLNPLPNIPAPFTARRIYRSVNGQPFVLAGVASSAFSTFVDDGAASGLQLGIAGIHRSRLDGRLTIDPSVVVKSTARIEAMMGASLYAEGLDGRQIIFTSVNDDRFGGSGTFDTHTGSAIAPAAGDWGGLLGSPTSIVSLDHAVVAFGGGVVRLGGTFAGFNALELYQSEARITNSIFELNGDGAGGQTQNDPNQVERFGYGFNTSATIFVRGAQPVIVNNQFRNNNRSEVNLASTEQAAISINANALNHFLVSDFGRSTGLIDRFAEFGDNQGPLVRLNRLDNNSINGMVVRGQTLTTQSVWDDTDIVHVVFDEIIVPDFHSFGGLRVESSATESLVVKLSGASAGFTATGRPLEIDDRIGGSLQIVGQPGFPVVLTAFTDDSAGAGFRRDGRPQTDTNNDDSQTAGTRVFAPMIDQFTDTAPNVDEWFMIADSSGSITVEVFDQDGGVIAIDGLTPTVAPPLTSTRVTLNGVAPGSQHVFTHLLGTGLGLDHYRPNFTGVTQVFLRENRTSANDVFNSNSGTGTQTGSNIELGFDERFDTLPSNFADTTWFYDLDAGDQFTWRGFFDDFPGGADAARIDLIDPNGAIVASDTTGPFLPGVGTTLSTTVPTGQDGFWGVKITAPAVITPFAGHYLLDVEVLTGGVRDPIKSERHYLLPGSLLDTGGQPGEWRSIKLDQFSGDRNVEVFTENESPNIVAPGTNASINSAQPLGNLAPNEKSGDDNLRLGFELHGFLNAPNDIDIYSFEAATGTEVWFDIDRTTMALDTVVELIDAGGNVLARSDDSLAESNNPALLRTPLAPNNSVNQALLMQKTPPFQGHDFWSTNPRDAGMRVVLPGAANETNTYHVRIRSNSPDLTNLAGGQTSGVYQLQVRLRETDEIPGSTVRMANLRFATNGIEILGQAIHSPLLGESTEVEAIGSVNDAGPVGPRATGTLGSAQDLGNLSTTDRAALAVGGNLSFYTDIDFFHFQLDAQLAPDGFFGTIFDIDYADGVGRPDTSLAVFQELRELDAGNNVVFVYRLVYISDNSARRIREPATGFNSNSNVADDMPAPLAPSGDLFADLARGSAGALDPYIGPAQLPSNQFPFLGATGHYFVAVHSDVVKPQDLRTNPLVRLEPIESVRRIAEDHIDRMGSRTLPVAADPVVPSLFSDHFILVPPSGVQIIDGETFTITAIGGAQATFEFDRSNSGVTGTNIPVAYEPFFTDVQVATAIVNAVTFAAIPGLGSVTQSFTPVNNPIAAERVHIDAPPTGRNHAQPLTVESISQLPAAGETATAMFVSSPGLTPFNLGDVTLFVSRNSTTAPERTQLFTADPFTGSWETFVGVFNRDVGDIALRIDNGGLFAFSRDTDLVNAARPQDDTSGNFLRIDTFNTNPSATLNITQIGDDGLLTHELDFAAPPAAIRSHVVNGTAVGDGIQFNATAFTDGILGFGYRLFAVGNRENNSGLITRNGNAYSQNIMFELDPNTGAAVGFNGANDRISPGLGTGAGTQKVEVGQLRTDVDAVNGSGGNLVTQRATSLGGAAILTDGLKITVTLNGADTIFELDSGPDVDTNINPLGGQFVRDGQVFLLNDGTDDHISQFNTGPVFNLNGKFGSAFVDGQRFTITDNAGTPVTRTFEFQQGGTPAPVGAIPIPFNNSTPPNVMALNIRTAINGAGFAVTASILNQNNNVFGQRITLTNDTNVTLLDPALVPALNVEGSYGEAPILSPNAAADLTGKTFTVDLRGGQLAPLTSGVTRTFQFGGTGATDVQISYTFGVDNLATILANMATAINGVTDPITFKSQGFSATVVSDKVLVVNGLSVAVNLGGATPGVVRLLSEAIINVEETQTITQIGPAVVAAVNGIGLFTASNQGTRINFLGTSIPNAAITGDFRGTPTFISRNTVGGAQTAGAIPVGFLAADTATEIATKIAAAVNTNLNPRVTATVSVPDEVVFTAQFPNDVLFVNAESPLRTLGLSPGGNVTGMAFVGSRLFAVSDTGGFFEVFINQRTFNSGGTGGFDVPLDFLNTTATSLLGLKFAGLTKGPNNLEGGRFDNLLFGITDTGVLVAFNTQGIEQPIFVDGQSRIQVTLPTGAAVTAGDLVNGLAFSNLDVNLWHVTKSREGDAGHGGNGQSLYFGYENTTENYGRNKVNFADPDNVNNYDLPGGAYGSIVSNRFSLEGYSSADQPALYFDYFADMGANDTFRVFVSSDVRTNAGNPLSTRDNSSRWTQVGVTLDNANPPAIVELPSTSGEFHQVRVALDAFAGQKDLRLRFDFSSSGDMDLGNPLTTGDELRAIDAAEIVDGTTFTIDNQIFEFDLGFSLLASPGARLSDHDTFTIGDGATTRTFEFLLAGSAPTGTNRPIFLSAAQTAGDVAEAIRQAIVASGLAVSSQVTDNRVNLSGATSTTLAVTPGSIVVQGAPNAPPPANRHLVPIHAGMDAAAVATVIQNVLSPVFDAKLADGVDPTIYRYNDVVRVIGHSVVVPFNFAIGLANVLPRDAVENNPDPGTPPVGFHHPNRGVDNNHEGVYLDHIIIGFAERGENVLAAGDNTAFDIPPINQVPAFQVLNGDYQLEIRRGADYVVPRRVGDPLVGDPERAQQVPVIATLGRPTGVRSFDTNDRLASGVAIVAPAGINLIDGQTFTVGNGISTVVFEYDDLQSTPTGVAAGRVAIPFRASMSAFEVAMNIRNAINSTPSQNVINVQAALSDGVISNVAAPVTGIITTGNVVNLFGPAVVRGNDIYISEFNDTLATAFDTGINATNRAPFFGRGRIDDNERLAATPGLDVDLLKVQLLAGQRIQIDIDAVQLESTLDAVVRVLNAAGTQLAVSDDSHAPGELFSQDSYIDFVAPSTGTFFIGVSGFSNIFYNPNAEGSGSNGSTGFYNINITFGAPGHTAIEFDTYEDAGDQNRFRDQGQIIIQQNQIYDSAQFGIVADAGTRGAGGLPHGGSVRKLAKINTDQWAPGPTIVNNVIVRGGSGGIHFSGDNLAGPSAMVPFGRIVNNTLVGRGANDVGILVDDRSSPSLLNNIVSGFGTGVQITDAGSVTTVVGGMLFHNNAVNHTVAGAPGNGGDDPLFVSLNGPLFVDAANDNYYLVAGSVAIDSGLDSLEDRNRLIDVRSPLGIPVSSILAPERDVTGQKRVDVIGVGDVGSGNNPFIDRGAFDRADFIGPSAILLRPQDNDSAGADQEPANTIVRLDPATILTEFTIQLLDGFNPNNPLEGTGVDDSRVTGDKVVLTFNGVTQVEGTDYTFAYDATSNIIRLVPLTGIWLPGNYVIKLENSANRFLIPPINAPLLVDGQTFAITDNGSPKKTVTFEFDNGFNLVVPAAGGGAGGISDGQTFTITNNNTNPAISRIFEFDDGTGLAVPNTRTSIPFISGATPSSADQIANAIVTAVSSVPGLGFQGAGVPVNVGGGRVVLGGTALHTVVLGSGSTLALIGAPGRQVAGSVLVGVNPNMTSAQVAKQIAAAINDSTLSGVSAEVLVTDEVLIRNASAVTDPGGLANVVQGGIKDLAGNDLKANQPNGETKFTILLGAATDFGDAPNSFGTLLTNDGARHRILPGYSLGANVTADADGTPAISANGDSGDDGVSLVGGFLRSGGANPGNGQVIVNFQQPAGGPAGVLNAWIDFNQDGTFSASEQLRLAGNINITLNANGDTTIPIVIPPETTGQSKPGGVIARFRLSSSGGLSPTGLATDGEVEDYQFTIETGFPFRNSTEAIVAKTPPSGALGQVGHLDVNDDGFVNFRDLLAMIATAKAFPEVFNHSPAGGLTPLFPLPSPKTGPNFPQGPGPQNNATYVDVAGPGPNRFSDNFFDKLDLQEMLAQIKVNPFGESEGAPSFTDVGEGESSAPPAASAGEGASRSSVRFVSVSPASTPTLSASTAETTSARFVSSPVSPIFVGSSAVSAQGVSTAALSLTEGLRLTLAPAVRPAELIGSGVELASGAVRRLSTPFATHIQSPRFEALESVLTDIAGEISRETKTRLAVDALFGEGHSLVPADLIPRTTSRPAPARVRGRR